MFLEHFVVPEIKVLKRGHFIKDSGASLKEVQNGDNLKNYINTIIKIQPKENINQ